jgi:Ca-activated chloride channel family protein
MYLPVGAAVALAVAALLVAAGLRLRRALVSFGERERVHALRTFDATKRRAYKGVLLCAAVLLVFLAAARPQYGKGTRLVPATNVDVVLVLDYSKSMYAQDVQPSRIYRAKIEVARLIQQLRGARFGAVAFAGEPMGFPLTADGAAIAQFLRQLEPNDMPVGGTAIARALSYARELLARDPKSRDHKRIVMVVTDGEDLEGNPVAVARNLGREGTTVHVVQIGGRTPERIPEIGEDGRVVGWRTDPQGKPLVTGLTPEGEKQLEEIAGATPGGLLVRAAAGTTGIEEIARELRRQMKTELSERVESVYADVYQWPLALALLFLLAEALIGDAPKRNVVIPTPPPARTSRLRRGRGARAASPWAKPPGSARPRRPLGVVAGAVAMAAAGGMASPFALAACSGWDPTEPFVRRSPEVDKAIERLDAGDPESAEQVLARYLGTGECSDAGIGLPAAVFQKADGSFDLGLALFHLAEKYGQRFGEEEADAGAEDPDRAAAREIEIGCALALVRALASDAKLPAALRARASYLAGNLEFMRRAYQDAVHHYDRALGLVPGVLPDAGGDEVGRDAAWNRAIALRRIQEQQDAGPDAPPDAPPDAEPDAGQDGGDDGGDAGRDAGDDAASQSTPDAGGEDADAPDAGDDGGGQDGGPPPAAPEDREAEPPPGDPQIDSLLEQLEEAPTYQEEQAKRRAAEARRRRVMEDK